jgi:hypothetical protein
MYSFLIKNKHEFQPRCILVLLSFDGRIPLHMASCCQNSLQGLMGVVPIEDEDVGFLRGTTNTVGEVVEPADKYGTFPLA